MMDLIQKARAQMCVKNVFWATLMMNTQFVEDRTCDTAWTDMTKVGYNPDFLESLDDVELVKFVIAHELGHIMMRHGLRAGSREHDLWNRACDYVLNLMLKDSGFKVWMHCLIDEKYEGMSPEQVYNELEREYPKQSRPQNGQGSPQAGPGQPGQQGGGQGPNPSPGPGAPRQSPSGGGSHRPGLPEDRLGGDLHPCPAAHDQAKASQIDHEIRGKVARAATMAKLAGRLPAGLERLIEEILSPPQRWQDLFSEFMTRLTSDDESWSRRNRRFTNIYLPARHVLRMGEVTIIGDTSGSMDDKVFGMVANEINAMVEYCKPERVRVIWADDTDCALEEVFEPGDEIVLHPKGGGGTDMRRPLRFAERYDPAVVVLVTDGGTPWPTSVPYPLIVLCTTGMTVPVGNVVRVSV